MRQNPERLAWTILLVSFAVCVALFISVPLATRWWINTAYVGLSVVVRVQQGTLQLTCGNDTVPIAIHEPMNDVCQGVESMTVLTLSSDQGTFIVSTRDAPQKLVAEIQVSNNTRLKILYARAPRFSISSQPYTLVIRVESGRARVNVASGTTRSILVQANTPDALVQTSEGSAAIQVEPGETQVGVHDGAALVIWNGKGEGVRLTRFQSVIVPPPDGNLQARPAAQNMIVDGDFNSPLEPAWQTYSKDIEFEGESGGQISVGAGGGVTVVGVTRVGTGHAETGITQAINRDVKDFQSIQLRLVLRVLEQDVPVCGTRGTECPMMVKIDYEDAQGDVRSWLQGFYSKLDPANPPYCTICNPRADHLRVEQGTWFVYDSPDLIPLLSQAGPPPARILSITLYASGHTYRSEVSLVELLVQ